jgi:hypothetical protein
LKTNWNSTWFNWPSHLMAVFLQIMLQFFENRLVFHVDSIMVLIHSVIAPAIVYNSDLTRNSITCVHTFYNIYIYTQYITILDGHSPRRSHFPFVLSWYEALRKSHDAKYGTSGSEGDDFASDWDRSLGCPIHVAWDL